MSHFSETQTFTMPLTALPAAINSQAEYDAFNDGASTRAWRRDDQLHYVSGSTRSGYAIYTFGNILASFDLPALVFLTDGGQQYAYEGEYGVHGVEVLDAARQRAVIAQMNELFAALKADPMIVYNAEEYGHLSDNDVEDALARDYVCAAPYPNAQVRGDDGESADYMFVFLRSVLRVVENALDEGLLVVHSVEM
ncbi:hypothetical protein LXA47_21850 [Massilia sp. P8910]|uniref:hypothetical protein n=1 Tax=Massilia antarctica TaxID=2765360 RepID=UPI0006BB78E8|nr:MULTISPECIES: hypothetical protein [Massilia]MCE3606229.1 hypothetical protein [Massilia antarctica]MCY0910469.1 hypothetical protein [Massilia sp. H27-R4]CUI09178.1 hypothetical protein BN2497_13133 [Janthinobacterium sp. CG23_2]CUU32964.1 hypothetical protein BN3177_13133 [Janthinobacterium sp. CG23_2]